MIKSIYLGLCFFCSACSYHFEEQGISGQTTTLSIPYIPGDPEGIFHEILVQTLSQSGMFECVSTGGEWQLEISILNDTDTRIGYRYDRDPTTGKRRDNIIGTENREVVTAQVKLINRATEEVIVGPYSLKGFSEYDYVDSNSIRDLTFINPQAKAETVLDFSLGQLDSIEGAHTDAKVVCYRNLSGKILNGLLAQSF